MRMIAAHLHPSPLIRARTIGDIVSQRHNHAFFERDYVKIILPLLQESDIGAAGVLDDEGRLSGLLTDRLILRHIFARSADKLVHPANFKKYIDDMTVEDVMIPEPETLEDHLSVEEAATIMFRRGHHFMPVVSRFDGRRLLGIVSEHELAVLLQHQLQETRKSETAHRSMLSYMLAEPYGAGYAQGGAG